MFALFIGQIIEQLPSAHIRSALRGLEIILPRLGLHRGGLLANLLQPQRTNEPDRAARDEASDMLAADHRDVLAESLAIKRQETIAVPCFFLAHSLQRL